MQVYPRKINLTKMGRSLKKEEKPELNDMSEISRAVAARLVIAEPVRVMVIKAA